MFKTLSLNILRQNQTPPKIEKLPLEKFYLKPFFSPQLYCQVDIEIS